jgi:hypothetical protein
MKNTIGHTLSAILLVSLIATEDPHGRDWNHVHNMRSQHARLGLPMGSVDSMPATLRSPTRLLSRVGIEVES